MAFNWLNRDIHARAHTLEQHINWDTRETFVIFFSSGGSSFVWIYNFLCARSHVIDDTCEPNDSQLETEDQRRDGRVKATHFTTAPFTPSLWWEE